MINFDSLTLKALLNEIEPVLTAGRVQKVQQPSRDEILLGIRSGGKNYKLYICANPKFPHISFITPESEYCRDIEIPNKPPMFCMLLRKHMEGAKIRNVIQPDYERIVEIYFDSYNELGARVPLVLACEFMGKYSNIILYNYDKHIIFGSTHTVSAEKSREREVAGGLPYVYPSIRQKIDLTQITEWEFVQKAMVVPTSLDKWLNQSFYYISLALAGELCKVSGIDTDSHIVATPKDRIIDLYHLTMKTLRLENMNPSISKDYNFYSLVGLDPDIEWNRFDSANTMVDSYFGHQMYLDKFSRLKTSLLSVTKKEIKKLGTKLEHYKKNIESEEKAERYKYYADLIMANLSTIRTGQDSVKLISFYDGELVEIQLDPSKTANANAQKYYKLYTKAKHAAKISQELLRKINEELSYFESIDVSLDQAESLEELRQIQEELAGQNIIKVPKRPLSEKTRKITLSCYTSSDGYKIYIGKNNRQNDYIVSKFALPDDIWMHTQNISGSHVLIKLPENTEEIPENTLKEAANLAVYFSQAKDSANVPVIFTKRKFLKKPPGSKPGYVTYSHEKMVAVNPDKDLIKKLIVS